LPRAVIRSSTACLAGLALLLPACARSFTRPVGEGDLADGSGGSSGDNSGGVAGQNRSGSYFWYAGDSAGNGWFGTEGYDYSGGYGAYGGEDNYCGDGVIGGYEQCDGSDLGGLTCAALGEGQGTLTCYQASCTFDVSMCVTEEVYPTAPPSPFPDGTVYEAPKSPEACMNLSSYLVRTYTPYTLQIEPRRCLCSNCLDSFAYCLVDYDCLNIIACCGEAGSYTDQCQLDPLCSNVILAALTGGPEAAIAAMDVSGCLQSECMDAPPTP
jgi:hypothetical protein